MDTNTHSRKNFRIPFKMRIAMFFHRQFGKQITVARSGGLTYVVLTREHGKFSSWQFREKLSGKNAKQAAQSAIARHPGYLLFFPKKALKKALADKKKEK